MTAAIAPTSPPSSSARAPGDRSGALAATRPPAAGGPARAAFRPGLVARERLLARLAASAEAPLVVLVAPAGYGKTTTLAEWAEADERPFAWVALGEHTCDTTGFVGAVARALDEITPGAPILGRPSRRPEGADMLVERLARAVAARRRPFVLVLDDADPLMAAPGVVAALELLRRPPVRLAGRDRDAHRARRPPGRPAAGPAPARRAAPVRPRDDAR